MPSFAQDQAKARISAYKEVQKVLKKLKSRPEISVLSTKSRLAYKPGIIDAFIEVADLIGQEQEILDELKFEARS